MDELFSEFLTDSAERLGIAEAALVRTAGDPRGLDAAIHQVHAIRGTASFMEAPRLSALIEAAERMLLAARRRNTFTAAEHAAFARCAERMRGIIAGAQDGEPLGDDTALLEKLGAAEHANHRSVDHIPERFQQGAWRGLAADAREARETLSGLVPVAGPESGPIEAIVQSSLAIEAETHALRRVPMESICRALPRLAEQAAALIGKQVEVRVESGGLTLDAPIATEMRAALVHLVRNAVAHGVETPDLRRARGKPEAGTIRIAARRDGGDVCIDVSDDGIGLDLAAIRRRGIENGMIGAAQAVRLSDEETLSLLFAPGFSTARHVTALSGCGIGLDAVKASIETLGGRLEIESMRGAGLTYRMRLPQSAAAAPVIVLDPAHAVHERLRPMLGAAGYEITEGIALEPVAAPVASEDRKEQTA
jgi:two-component system chemotaxis sensor kinase CheA